MDRSIKRVVAYARVSTAYDDQKNSFENQQSYFLRELAKNDGYELVRLSSNRDGIYADRGISGTKLVRPEFKKMLEDAGLHEIVSEETGKLTGRYEIVGEAKFDIIFVKDTSRFARNASVDDILKTLRANGVIVHFLDMHKTTEKYEDLTAIQIFLSLSESESTRKSDSVKFGYKEGARKGNIYMGGKIFGYDYIRKDPKNPFETNILKVNDAEAKVIRRVYDMYTEEGLGHQQICKKLGEEGYYNSNGKQYTRSTIKRWLCNEKYAGVNTAGRYTYGDIFNKRQQEIDYNDEVRVKAREETQRLADEGIVTRIPAIVSREQFEKAQDIMKHNRKAFNCNCTYHGITDYARKIKCGKCGAYYISASRRYNDQKKMDLRYYACSHRHAYDEAHGIEKCTNPSIREDKLDAMLSDQAYSEQKYECLKHVIEEGEKCIRILRQAINVDTDLVVRELNEKIDVLKGKKNKLLPLYMDEKFDREQLDQMTSELNEQIDKETEKCKFLSKHNDGIRDLIHEVEEIVDSAEREKWTIEKYNMCGIYPVRSRKEQLQDIESITINADGNPEIVLKSLVEIEKTKEKIVGIAKIYSDANVKAKPHIIA